MKNQFCHMQSCAYHNSQDEGLYHDLNTALTTLHTIHTNMVHHYMYLYLTITRWIGVADSSLQPPQIP